MSITAEVETNGKVIEEKPRSGVGSKISLQERKQMVKKGAALRELRKSRGVTREDFAEQLGINVQKLGHLEAGRHRNPNCETHLALLQKLAGAKTNVAKGKTMISKAKSKKSKPTAIKAITLHKGDLSNTLTGEDAHFIPGHQILLEWTKDGMNVYQLAKDTAHPRMATLEKENEKLKAQLAGISKLIGKHK